jgi:hypothetical protein
MGLLSSLRDAITGKSKLADWLVYDHIRNAAPRFAAPGVHPYVADLGLAAARVAARVLDELIFDDTSLRHMNAFYARQRELTPQRTLASLCILAAYFVRRAMAELGASGVLLSLGLTDARVVEGTLECLGGANDDLNAARLHWQLSEGNLRRLGLTLYASAKKAAFAQSSTADDHPMSMMLVRIVGWHAHREHQLFAENDARRRAAQRATGGRR